MTLILAVNTLIDTFQLFATYTPSTGCNTRDRERGMGSTLVVANFQGSEHWWSARVMEINTSSNLTRINRVLHSTALRAL